MSDKGLNRFVEAHRHFYPIALSEIKNGRKASHWMWFIFPQIKGLGTSETAKYYAIDDLAEATAFLGHPVLGRNLVRISEELLNITGKTAIQVFGTPDDLKLRSSMTLFANVAEADPVFTKVLQKYFNGLPDQLTLAQLEPA